MRTLFRLGCLSLLFGALSYTAFVMTDGRGSWPSTPKYLVVLGMYGFTALGVALLIAVCLARLISFSRSNK
ncbi:hypothetical protein [Tunturiibacter gelidoferens]|uniref:Uncharacterized protein n=3 Tax=Tunturiibacter TaxID=3154218 RepID=A0A7Y9NM96_9BACT|nr:hypothetical protein [Edaphobacter lichenicola]MBB5339361.1 hypothetical protein [Edaphobacter lichenicola]NYF51380.1 hypothetical protein [Edaphobacter lichenicola]